jgi:tetratricopeptide (TPR) repeat protein
MNFEFYPQHRQIHIAVMACMLALCLHGAVLAQDQKITQTDSTSRNQEIGESSTSLLMGRFHFEREDWENSIAFYEAAIPERVMTLGDYNDLAYAHMRLKQYAEGGRILNTILEYYPDHRIALLNLSIIYYKSDRKRAALGCIEHAIVLDSTDMESWVALGIVAVGAGRLDRAWTACDKLYPVDLNKAIFVHGLIMDEIARRSSSLEE